MSTVEEVRLARRLADFERRLRGLERATRLDRATIVVDDTGRSVGVTGAVVAGSREAVLAAARALVPLIPPQPGVAVSVHFTTDEPVEAAPGDLWLRPDSKLVLSQPGGWLEPLDQTGAPAVAGLRSALTTDDGRIVVWADPAAPTGGPAPAFGDLWLQADTVAYRWEGDAGWQPLVTPEGQSLNYVAGEEGWTITPDGDSQFRDLSALGQVSGAVASFDAITLAGEDLQTVLGGTSVGKILSARLPTQGSNIGLTTTSTKILELNCGMVKGGRTYRIETIVLLNGTTGAGAINANTDRIQLLHRYTLDGSAPSTTSPVMDGGFGDNSYVAGNLQMKVATAEVDIVTDAPLRIGVIGNILAGVGAYYIYAGSSNTARPVMSLYDDGPSGVRNDSAISLTGGGIARYTKTFPALWSWGINSDGNPIYDSYFYVGNGAYGAVGQYGLVGFDSAAIVAGLAGLSAPVSCALRWKPRTRATSAGLDVRILSHNYASRAAAQSALSWTEDYTSSGTLTSRGISSNHVPGTSYDFALGTAVLSAFKAATIKGVGFANGHADPYASHPDGSGSVYGDGASECQLICVYDGSS